MDSDPVKESVNLRVMQKDASRDYKTTSILVPSVASATRALIPNRISETLLIFKNVLHGQERPDDERSIVFQSILNDQDRPDLHRKIPISSKISMPEGETPFQWNEEAEKAIKYVFKHQKSNEICEELKNILKNPDWQAFRYELDLSLRSKLGPSNNTVDIDKQEKIKKKMEEGRIIGSFTFLHMLILCKEFDILKHICEGSLSDEFARPVKINSCPNDPPLAPVTVVKEDRWIFDANGLHLAAKFMPQGLELLLSNLVDSKVIDKNLIDKGNHDGTSPLHISAQNLDSLSTRILLSYGADVNGKNEKGQTPLFYASMARSSANIIELLNYGHADVNIEANNRKTALSKSRSFETTMALIEHNADTTSSFDYEGKKGQLKSKSDLHKMMQRKCKSSSKAILSQCISEVNEELLVLDLVHFGPPNTTEEKNEMDLHLKVSKYGLDDLLVHPIMQACSDIKWNMFSKIYWITMLFDLLFAIVLTIVGNYFVTLTHCYPCNDTKTDWSMKKFICMNISNCSLYDNCIKGGLKCDKGFLLGETESPYELENICQTMDQDISQCWFRYPSVYILYILLIVYIIREIFEMIRARCFYFSQYLNYFQIVNVVLATIFVLIAPYNTFMGNHFGAWAVFVAWINLTRFLGSSRFFGRYLIMAFDVLKKVVKMLFVFLPSFLAFVFAFNMMLKGNSIFHDLKNTVIKIFTMMTGEFEYDGIFSFGEIENNGGSYGSTQVLFFLFVTWMAIIVMNLLIGLAISSIEELVENGEKIQVFKRVEAMIAGTRLPSNTTFGNFEKKMGIIPDVKIMKLFEEANMTSRKICVKLSPENKKFAFGFTFSKNYFGMMEPMYKVYFYDNEQIGAEISGWWILAKTVKSARETITSFEEEINNFQSKMNVIKSKSDEAYRNFLREFNQFKPGQIENSISTHMKDKSTIEMIATARESFKNIGHLLETLEAKGIEENQS